MLPFLKSIGPGFCSLLTISPGAAREERRRRQSGERQEQREQQEKREKTEREERESVAAYWCSSTIFPRP